MAPSRYEAQACDRIASLPRVRRWLQSKLRDFKPDVAHVLLFHAQATVATIGQLPCRGRFATHVYGGGLRITPHARIKEAVDRWAGSRFDHTVAISESVGRFLVSEYGYPKSKVSVIPLGWEGAPLVVRANGRPPTIICVANFRPEKGHRVLLAAFKLVQRQLPDAHLILIGQGELQRDIESQIESLGISDHVEITGPVPEVWPYLARAHVFALASQSEAYGIAVAEAMAAGLPIVASDVGGIPELVVPGVSGELFPPGDTDMLADQLVKLLTSPALRERMGTAAKAAARPLTLESSARKYLDLWEQLIADPVGSN